MRHKPRVFYGQTRKRPTAHQPDPYSPSAPDYAERNRVTAVEVSPSLTMVSIGEPPKRITGEAQPVEVAAPPVATVAPAAPRTASPAERPAQTGASRERSRNWQDDYGLAKRA